MSVKIKVLDWVFKSGYTFESEYKLSDRNMILTKLLKKSF